MNLHANARTCPHCRLLIVESVLRDSKTANEVALQFKVSSRTVHKWIGRYRQAGTKDFWIRPQLLILFLGARCSRERHFTTK
jgi:transposase-like protein